MPTYRFSKRISPMDVYELFKSKGIKPSDVTVEEDGDEVRVIVNNAVLTSADEDALNDLMRMLKRKR